jgi:Flp pilus assembly pilin Flp
MDASWYRRFASLLKRLCTDDSGQDLIEYVLLTGIIAIAGILVFPIIQTKMASAYQAWNTNAQDLWDPPPPM